MSIRRLFRRPRMTDVLRIAITIGIPPVVLVFAIDLHAHWLLIAAYSVAMLSAAMVQGMSFGVRHSGMDERTIAIMEESVSQVITDMCKGGLLMPGPHLPPGAKIESIAVKMNLRERYRE